VTFRPGNRNVAAVEEQIENSVHSINFVKIH
jgi:hypothetical protein